MPIDDVNSTFPEFSVTEEKKCNAKEHDTTSLLLHFDIFRITLMAYRDTPLFHFLSVLT